MTKLMKPLLTCVLYLLSCNQLFAGHLWQLVQPRQSTANHAAIYKVDKSQLDEILLDEAATGSITIELPLPDGNIRNFYLKPNGLLPPALAAKYPGIKTFDAVAADNPVITAKIELTTNGFHAMIYDGKNTTLIDPEQKGHTSLYAVHYKRDEVRRRADNSACATVSAPLPTKAEPANTGISLAHKAQSRVTNGYELRKYRLALACTYGYASKVSGSATPAKAEVLEKMATTMNRVNGIYERELSITMVFVDKEDTLIFNDAANDPFDAAGSSQGLIIALNQEVCDSFIGSANYDLGHVFIYMDGGLSQVAVVCNNNMKAQSLTGSLSPQGDGFDVDYVSHEIGHQFGTSHSFNNAQSGGCRSNAIQESAYEPGSGSTIMAYAGLCSPDNIQINSDDYFHAISLRQAHNFITHAGDVCAVKTPTNNKPVGLPAFANSYNIPYLTPFELTAPDAIDSSSGSATITYCWEEWDLGGFGQTLKSTSAAGPLFRSYPPTQSPVRMFPNLEMVRNGIISNAENDGESGEKLPEVSRELNFKLTTRSIVGGHGCFNIPDDSIRLNVFNTGKGGFTVSSQNETGLVYSGYSSQNVIWDVAGTNTGPINADKVDIYLSADSGKTWEYHLGTFPNTGSAAVIIPNPDNDIQAARIKVKGTDNVFFNMNLRDFKVTRNFESAINVYPVPAHNTLHVKLDRTGVLNVVVSNAIGAKVWESTLNSDATLDVTSWARGVYIMKLVNTNNVRVVKRIVLN